MYNWTLEGQRRALRLVDEALAIVGDSLLLLATKGQLHWNMVNMNMAPAGEALARASDFVNQALELDPESSLAVFVRGDVRRFEQLGRYWLGESVLVGATRMR
jgi:hypothetical protein